jgi:hypothetical protein
LNGRHQIEREDEKASNRPTPTRHIDSYQTITVETAAHAIPSFFAPPGAYAKGQFRSKLNERRSLLSSGGEHQPYFLTVASIFPALSWRQLVRLGNLAMIKERVSARELAELISVKVSVVGLEIVVRKDHAYGWQPNVVAAPGDLIGYQRRVEDIAHRLRVQYDLRD